MADLEESKAKLRRDLNAARAKLARMDDANHRIGSWLSAALEDKMVCEKMKNDVRYWFELTQ